MIGVILLILLAIALIVAGVVWSYLHKKKMREAFTALAAERGWTFIENDTRSPHEYEAFGPFGKGSARRFDWLLEGEHEGVRFRLFQYHYETHSTDSKGNRQTHHHIHRGAAATTKVQAPALTIVRENIFHKIGDALGGEDIDFESDEFSRKYWVKCKDRQFAYAVIHPDMIEYLLPRRGWSWEWRGKILMLHKDGSLKPEACASILATIMGFHERIPRHLRAEASN